jgi:hypothetical protein
VAGVPLVREGRHWLKKTAAAPEGHVLWKENADREQPFVTAIASTSGAGPVTSFDSMYRTLAMLLGAAWLFTAEAKAAPPDQIVSPAPSPARTRVVFGTIGIRAQPRDSLISLLAAELRGLSLSLEEDQPQLPLSVWANQATRSEQVLAAILLDGRREQGWRVIVIDAARGRAIARALPGGIRDDAASIEAVVSIIVSAASALHEGLEVASTPLAAVVGGPPAPPEPPSTARAADGADGPVASRPENWAFRGAVGASVASFAPAVPTTLGAGLALGLSFRARFEARAFGTAFMPSLMTTPLGDFRVARTLLGAAAGPVFKAPAFSFAPEAGVVAERTRRYDAAAGAGVFATESSALYRVGALLALRLRHTLYRPLSVELVTGTVYFGRRLQFTARSAENSWSESAWPAVAFAQLGLELATN